MQVYTKILIGMLVGVLIGLLLGPNSSLLPHDAYKVTAPWDRLDLRTEPTDSAPRLALPKTGKPSPGTTAPAIRLHIVEVRHEAIADQQGELHELPTWSKVHLEYSQTLSLKDTEGTLHAQLGEPELGESVEVWLRHEQTALTSGGFTVWPVPISGLGDTIIATIKPIGTAFMRLITMVIVPLVFASLVVGVASLGDLRKLGRLGVRTLGLYLVTTAIAVAIGIGMTHLIDPGGFIDERSSVSLRAQFDSAAGSQVERAAESPSMIDNILNVIPVNPVQSLVTGDMLQIIFFAILFGVALTFLDNKEGRPLVTMLDRVQNAMVVIIHIVMKLAPYGVAALVAEVVGTSGLAVLKGLAMYSVAVLIGLLLHVVVVYGFLVRYFARLPLRGFFRAIRPAQLIAFSTSSSSATLPVTMECAEQNLGISNPVASFVLPLGSTVNMDGTALYQGVAAMFIAQVFNMDLSLGDQLGIVLTATLASIGAAGVPGAGMVTLAMVLTGAGIPTVGVALILGVDRLLDMFRTTVNITGDLAVAAMMGRFEGDRLHVLGEVHGEPPPGSVEARLDTGPEPVDPE